MKKILKLALSITATSAAAAALTIAAAAEYKILPSGDTSGNTDTAAIQQYLTISDSTIILEKGNYYIKSRLMIDANNITIQAKDAVIRQVSPETGIVANKVRAGKYDSNFNITIDGGTWIGNTEKDTTKEQEENNNEEESNDKIGYSGFRFAHCKNVTIKNAVFLDNFNGHLIELAGVKGGRVENCTLGGKYVGTGADEAIQLDITHSPDMVGNLGNDTSFYDDTSCDDIKIINNTITYPSGIGSHSKVDNHPHTNIQISGNTITASNYGLLICNYYYVKIFNNTIKSALNGITVRTYARTISNHTPNNPDEPRWTQNDERNYGIEIYKNNITNCTSFGIRFIASKEYPSFYSYIKENTISKTGSNAISTEYTNHLSLLRNTISKAGHSGIACIESFQVDVSQNNVSGSVASGVTFKGSSHGRIYKNTFSDSSDHGIILYNGSYLCSVLNNSINSPGDIGIYINGGSYNTTVSQNTISNSKGRGIAVTESAGCTITKNTVKAPGGYGIHVYNNSPNSVIEQNSIQNGKSSGIQITNGCSLTNITSNNISSVAKNGISISGSTSVSIIKNTVKNAGAHGIFLNNAAESTINTNNVSHCKENGIYSLASNNISILSNSVKYASLNGISFKNGILYLRDNSVVSCNGNGAYIVKAANSTVTSNTFKSNALRGIRITEQSDSIYVSGNVIYKNRGDGIIMDKTSHAVIRSNTITVGYGRNGISVLSGKDFTIAYNNITGDATKVISVSSSAAGNVKTIYPVVVKSTVKVKKTSKIIISGNCDKTSTVKISLGKKSYSTKKLKKDKAKFSSTKKIQVKPGQKLLVTQTSTGKNTYSAQITIQKKKTAEKKTATKKKTTEKAKKK